jgi:branched-subunit amino acid transport protein
MADFEGRRLGKRGAYRLGAARVRGPRSGSGPVPRQPSFQAGRSRGSALAWLAACAVAAVIVGFGAALGLWFLPFLAGIAAGIAPWRARSALALVVLAVLVGWGAALWWPALSGAPAGATARILAALAGLPPHAAVGVAATLLVGVLQGLVAVWLARAVTYRLR